MDVIEALCKVDRFAAKRHVLFTIDLVKGNALNAASMLQMSVPTLNKWIGALGLWKDVEKLIKVRKYKYSFAAQKRASKAAAGK